MSHVVLIDGHHMMYRAYWAIPRTLTTKEGEQINITFGMASMLINILQAEQPDDILICFDAGSETFRHIEHTEYKAGRAQTPDDFYPQLPRVLEFISTFGLPMFSDPRYEADDLLAMYAVAAAKRGDTVTIVSGDRDLFQLASDNIRIAIPHKGYQAVEYLRQDEVFLKLGVTPTQVPCYKALAGDSSDNLIGVPGIGPKTAAALLQTWGSLESIYEHISEITGSTQEKLLKNKEKAFFCKKLATLLTHESLPLPIEKIHISTIDLTPVFELAQKLQFTMVLRRLINLTKSDKFTLQDSYVKQPFVQKSVKNTAEDQLSLF